MNPSLLDQAQPILIIAVLAGLVIGAVVFVGARLRLAGHHKTDRQQGSGTDAAQPSSVVQASGQASTPNRPLVPARRPLSRDTRQRATNLIDDIARFYQDRHTG